MGQEQRRITLVNSAGATFEASIVACATDSRGVTFAKMRASSSAGGRFLGYFFPTYVLVNGQWELGGVACPDKALKAIAATSPGERIKASGRWWTVGNPKDVPSRLAYR